jgi:hypothetical protein
MSLSDVIRNITKTVTDKDELKGRARDLPLLVVQTTLSAAGQALQLMDRLKNSIKGLGGKQEETEEERDSRPQNADAVAAPVAEDKPARKEPVIFAPRPGAAEPNGAAKTKPDPVIFSPAAKPVPEPESAPEPKTAEAPAPAATEAKAAAPVTEAKAPAAEAKPAEAPAPVVEAKPVVSEAPAPEAAVVPEPAVAKTVTPEPVAEPAPAAEAEPAPEVVAEPVAEPKAKAKPKTAAKAKPKPVAKAEPKPEPEPEVKVVEAVPAQGAATDLPEPLPGYSELTVASLRARMRGKSAEQIAACLAYEQATTVRAEVVRMYENRLAKLRAGE